MPVTTFKSPRRKIMLKYLMQRKKTVGQCHAINRFCTQDLYTTNDHTNAIFLLFFLIKLPSEGPASLPHVIHFLLINCTKAFTPLQLELNAVQTSFSQLPQSTSRTERRAWDLIKNCRFSSKLGSRGLLNKGKQSSEILGTSHISLPAGQSRQL